MIAPGLDGVIAISGALAIALVAMRFRALTPSGAIAAWCVGSVSLLAGPSWGAYLILWFATASALSRAGRRIKAARLARVVQKDGARGAVQVLANGLAFAVCAAVTLAVSSSGWSVNGEGAAPWAGQLAIAGAAALAAAGADTWATEIGTWWRADAWSVRLRMRVPAGTSGAVTVPGTLALIAGAGTYAALAVAVDLIPRHAAWVVLLAGVAGAVADTLLGAWWQERRRCEACGEPTEQQVHACGAPTRVAGGLAGFRNDAVNLAATLVAAALAAATAAALSAPFAASLAVERTTLPPQAGTVETVPPTAG